MARVLDSDYRGNVKITIMSHGEKTIKVTKGQRIAQFILENIYTPMVEVVNNLTTTIQEDRGFGSTNKVNNGKNTLQQQE